MKFVLVLAAVIGFASAAAVFDASLDEYWNEFKLKHGKVYANKVEETKRRSIWEKNLKFINTHNLEASLGKHTFRVAMNKFGDLTNKEFTRQMTGFNATKAKPTKAPLFVKPSNVKIPDSGNLFPSKSKSNSVIS